MDNEGREVVESIILQLGGIVSLKAMIGASNFSYNAKEKSLSFKFKLFRRANYLRITLTDSDTYTMEFIRATVKSIKVVESFENVYDDGLVPTFQSVTGLDLTMPRIRGAR